MNTKSISHFFIIIVIIFLAISCQSQKETEYKNAITSNEINDIEKYIKEYPNDSQIDQLKFKLRVVEYERIKKSKNILLLNYFIKKYKTGRDVEKIKDTIFDIKLSYKKNNLEYLNHLKTIFNEEKYSKIIGLKIYSILEKKLSKSKIITNDREEEELNNFIERYPTSPLFSKLKERILNYQIKKIIKTKNLNTINNFIQKHPKYYNDEVKKEISNIILMEYKQAPINILKRYIDNNKDYENHKELEQTYIQRAYKRYLAFYEFDKLIELDKKYHLEEYKKSILWFKENKEKVLNINKTILSLYQAIKYTKDDKDKLYYITKNSMEESHLILKAAFFTNDINMILKKVSSNFLLTQISALKSLEYYYNQDIKSRKQELLDKYKSLENIKGKFYKEKIVLIALTLDDEKLFLKYLGKLIREQNKTLWINYLRYHFLNSNPINLIDLVVDISKIDFKKVYSDKTLEKNRIDRKINLSLTRVILNHILSNIQKQNLLTSKNINREINKLEYFLKDIQSFNFNLINNYEKNAVLSFKKLKKEIKISKLLKEDIINYSPFTRVKKELGFKCLSDWCNKKEMMLDILLRNNK